MRKQIICVVLSILFFSISVSKVFAVDACLVGDANNDGRVTIADFAVWRSIFLQNAPSPTATPTTLGISKVVGFSTSGPVTEMDGAKALGAKALRVDFAWPYHEPNAPVGGVHTYDFFGDEYIRTANEKGIKLLGIPDFTPLWASDSGCQVQYADKCAPTAAAITDYAAYVGALVERYDGDGVQDAPGSPVVHAWEIWNEPNNAIFWRPTPNAAAYAQLLSAAYTAAKQSNPQAVVISGGMSPSAGATAPIQFLKDMYANGAKGKFDAVGMHPYSYPAPASTAESWNTWQQMFKTFPEAGQPDSIRSVMEKNGDSAKQIWLTEVGAPTGGDTNGDGATKCDNGDGVTTGTEDRCITEAQQSTLFNEVYTLWQSYPWAGPLFWYTYRDGATGDTDIEQNFGVTRTDGTLKQAATTMQSLTK